MVPSAQPPDAASQRIVPRAGHGAQVTCVGWHPHMGLIASGSRDSQVILWDPKAGKAAHTMCGAAPPPFVPFLIHISLCCCSHGHKNEVQALEWNPSNPHWLVTGSRDQSLRFFDLRTLSAFQAAVIERKGVTSLAWHPFQERLLAVGNHDGSLQHWAVGLDYAQADVPHAHDSTISTVAWAPAGNVLVSGSYDSTAKCWGRSRPGDTAEQYAYHGNPMRGYPRDTTNLVPVPGTAAAAAAAATGAYGSGLAPRTFDEQESDRTAEASRGGGAVAVAISSNDFSVRAASFSGSGGSRAGQRPGPFSEPLQRRSSGGPLPPLPTDYVAKTAPGETYRCKLCGLGGHWYQACPNMPQRSSEGPRSDFSAAVNATGGGGGARDAAGYRPAPPDYVCHTCGKTGHWRESCPLTSRGGAPGGGPSRGGASGGGRHVQAFTGGGPGAVPAAGAFGGGYDGGGGAPMPVYPSGDPGFLYPAPTPQFVDASGYGAQAGADHPPAVYFYPDNGEFSHWQQPSPSQAVMPGTYSRY